jgi:type I site-specific restriction endonuclease
MKVFSSNRKQRLTRSYFSESNSVRGYKYIETVFDAVTISNRIVSIRAVSQKGKLAILRSPLEVL